MSLTAIHHLCLQLSLSSLLQVKLLLEQAMPPLLPPETEGGEVRYDYRNPGYLTQVETNRRQARALALHASFPIFAEALAATGEPVDAERIATFIESRDLDDDVLEALFRAAVERLVEVQPHVGFS